MVTHLYRGIDPSGQPETLLTTNEIRGAEYTIFRGEVQDPEKTVPPRTDVADLSWTRGPELGEAAATGGVTSEWKEALRAAGTKSLVVVLDESRLSGFEPVTYDYHWFSDRPGRLLQIFSMDDGEIRLDDEGLWGTTKEDQSGTPQVENWSAREINRSVGHGRFIQEQEWVAPTDSVSVRGAVGAVVTFISPGGVTTLASGEFRDVGRKSDAKEQIPRLYDKWKGDLPDFRWPYYMVVFERHGGSLDGGLTPQQVDYIYDGDTFLGATSIPAYIRGVNG